MLQIRSVRMTILSEGTVSGRMPVQRENQGIRRTGGFRNPRWEAFTSAHIQGSFRMEEISLDISNDKSLHMATYYEIKFTDYFYFCIMGKTKEIFLAGGCFWGIEHYIKMIRGVTDTQTGFANGHTEKPTYKEVYTDTTGYAETVKVGYDPDILPLEVLIELFFKAIDPHSVNRQGEDEGTRYRTGVYFTSEEDLPVIRRVFESKKKVSGKPLAVELEPLKTFHPAEEYHQDYLDKNPGGYCHLRPELFEFARNANLHRP